MRCLLPFAAVLCSVSARLADEAQRNSNSLPVAVAQQLLNDLHINCEPGEGIPTGALTVEKKDLARMMVDTHCGGTAAKVPGCKNAAAEAHAHGRKARQLDEGLDELLDNNGDGMLTEPEVAAAWAALGLAPLELSCPGDGTDSHAGHDSHGRSAKALSGEEPHCLGYRHSLLASAYAGNEDSNKSMHAAVVSIPAGMETLARYMINDVFDPHCWDRKPLPNPLALSLILAELVTQATAGVTAIDFGEGRALSPRKGAVGVELMAPAGKTELELAFLVTQIAYKVRVSGQQVFITEYPSHPGTYLLHLWNATLPADCDPLTTEEVWVYSLFATLGVSVIGAGGCAFVGLIGGIHSLIVEALLAFSVGALIGDSFFHAIPELLGVHSHGDEAHGDHADHGDEKLSQYAIRARMALILGTIAFFYLLDALIRSGLGKDSHLHSHGGSANIPTEPYGDSKKEVEEEEIGEDGKKVVKALTVDDEATLHQKWCTFTPLKQIKSIGWINLGGDAVHNLTDGLAIAAAFHRSAAAGMTTSIAVVVHEVGQEVGDFALLVYSGMTPIQALCCNLIAAMTAMIGAVIGAAVGTNVDNSEPWFLCIVIGSFVYLSVGVTLPELVQMMPPMFKAKEKAEGVTNEGGEGKEEEEPEMECNAGEVILHATVQMICFAAGCALLFLVAVTEKEDACGGH